MPRSLSIYLDALRLFAALWVAVAHLGDWHVVGPEIAAWLPTSGRDAVVIFFVLSGFVITHSATNQRTPGPRTYAVGRLTRMYSVAAPVLLLTVAVDLYGLSINPGNYADTYQYDKLHVYIPLHLGFFGEFWHLSEQPFTIPPYWSLSYEFWYYVLFGSLFFYRGWRRWAFTLALLGFVGFKLWLLWPIWLAGAWLYRQGERWRLSRGAARGLALATVLAYLTVKLTGLQPVLWELGNAPFGGYDETFLGSAKKYLADYLTGVLVVVHLYAVRQADLRFDERLTKLIRWAASFTFTLYLLHGLVFKTIEHNLDYDRSSVLNAVLIFATMLVAVWVVGELTERRRALYRRPFGALLGWATGAVRSVPAFDRLMSPTRARA